MTAVRSSRRKRVAFYCSFLKKLSLKHYHDATLISRSQRKCPNTCWGQSRKCKEGSLHSNWSLHSVYEGFATNSAKSVAQSGHVSPDQQCPLVGGGVKRTSMARLPFVESSPDILQCLPLGGGGHLGIIAQPVHRLMLPEAAQLEMADLKDRRVNFHGESISHEQWPADILAEEF